MPPKSKKVEKEVAPTGKGVYTYPDGLTKYDGEVLEDKSGIYRHGAGTFYSAASLSTADLAAAEAAALQRGENIEAVADNMTSFTVFRGTWNRDVLQSPVDIAFSSGARYSGEINADGEFHGHGTYQWANGASYTGAFVNHTLHGEGTYVGADGREWHGTFAHNSGPGLKLALE